MPPAPVPPGSRLPEFTLSTPEGRLVEAGDLRGNVVVMTFVSASGASAAASRELVLRVDSVLERLRPELRRRVRPVAVSMDGDPGLSLVVAAASDPDAWLLLSGTPSQVDRLALPLEVVSWTDEERTTHTLRTLVISPDLHLADRFPGTAPWTESDLLATLARWARE